MLVTLEEYHISQAQVKKLRSQLIELNEKISILQGEVKILHVKSSAFQKQLNKKILQNKELIALLQKQQKQKISLLSKDRQLSYNQSRGEMEARRNETQVRSLNQQLQKLKAQITNYVSQKIKWLSQKQELSNKLLIVQQKYKATKNMEEIIVLLKNSLTLISKENDLLKVQVQELKKKLNSGGYIQKSIITNSNQVIDDLIKDFQKKLNAKQRAISELRESYEKKIADLNLTITFSQGKNQKYL